tara:strand:+ start:952 stop:1677 length:726 start_codon:yes stop_codon:yes gene_type:complete
MIKLRVKIISFLISINEGIFFYPKLKKVYKEIFRNKELNLAFDIGVNKGQTVKFFKIINPKVKIVGFEPHRNIFSSLINNNFENCQFFNKGCSDKDGLLLFKENILSESSTFEDVNLNSKWLKKKETIIGLKSDKLIENSYEVETIRLGGFIHKNFNHKIIDMLKIDVEGHEIKVLKGLFPLYSKRVLRFIQIENHFDDLYENFSNEIEELLKENGFEKERVIKHGFGKIVDIIFKNIYYE